MRVCEAELESEKLGLELPYQSPCSSATVETLIGEFRNLGLDGKLVEEDHHENTWSEENVNLHKDSSLSSKEERSEWSYYPQRPDEPDCSFYLKTGSCRYGSNCRFNHPPRVRVKQLKLGQPSAPIQVVKEKEEELPERVGQTECKYYSMPGGCKFGKACKYAHYRGKSEDGSVRLNFLGLPIRLGARECPYYMRTGGCKFATNCRFNHPDPIAVSGHDPVSAYQNVGPSQQHASGASQLPETSWPLHRTSNEPVPSGDASPSYIPGMLLPLQGHPLNPEWNGYQAPVNPFFPPGRNGQHPPASTPNGSTKTVDDPLRQQVPVEEYPERPGQLECQYFMKHGDCKYRSACKFHHPKTRLPKASASALNPQGLPLKPDQPVCTHYSRYGICKFGPNCRFDHPVHLGSSAASSQN